MKPKMKSLQAWDEKSLNGIEALHIKRDGHQTRVVKESSGKVIVLTRNDIDITKQVKHLPFMSRALSQQPHSTIMFGELWIAGGAASDIKTALKHRSCDMRLDFFGLQRAYGEPLEWSLQEAELWFQSKGFSFIPYRLCDFKKPSTAIEWMCKQELQDWDIEGYVLTKGNMQAVAKWKPVKTIDLICTGFTEGKGANIGLVGSITCSTVGGTELCTAGGFTEDMRLEISSNEQKYLGKVVEIKYQCVASNGRLRHPRFVRWREDKPADECTLNQDPWLVKRWC